jgi:hypothetical protein
LKPPPLLKFLGWTLISVASFIELSMDKTLGYWDVLIKEPIEIRLHPRNFNRDRSFSLCQF